LKNRMAKKKVSTIAIRFSKKRSLLEMTSKKQLIRTSRGRSLFLTAIFFPASEPPFWQLCLYVGTFWKIKRDHSSIPGVSGQKWPAEKPTARIFIPFLAAEKRGAPSSVRALLCRIRGVSRGPLIPYKMAQNPQIPKINDF
jgi:hypothetical protein